MIERLVTAQQAVDLRKLKAGRFGRFSRRRLPTGSGLPAKGKSRDPSVGLCLRGLQLSAKAFNCLLT